MVFIKQNGKITTIVSKDYLSWVKFQNGVCTLSNLNKETTLEMTEEDFSDLVAQVKTLP